MKKRLFLLVLLMVVCLPVFAAAHPGRTDSNGGHNSGHGYHYHHGYPEHQHTNGQCPYDFDDQTGRNSGKGGGGTTKERDTDSSSETGKGSSQEEPSKSGMPVISWIVLLIFAAPFLLGLLGTVYEYITSFFDWIVHRKKK